MRRSFSMVTLVVVLAAAVPLRAALADKVHLQAAFTVSFAASPNSPPVAYWGGEALDFKVEAHGDGYSSLAP
jgi:hypothetical protein